MNLYKSMRCVLCVVQFMIIVVLGVDTGPYNSTVSDENAEPMLYYYGLEESEHALPSCGQRQAHSVVLQLYWVAPAVLRLCRCDRRQRDHSLQPETTMELNNRAYMQFCERVTTWEACDGNAKAVVARGSSRLNELSHWPPPNVTVLCRCRAPAYWRLESSVGDEETFACAQLAVSSEGEPCGTVRSDTNALNQQAFCPPRHICVTSAEERSVDISELLYSGPGRTAYCRRLNDYYFDQDEDYNT